RDVQDVLLPEQAAGEVRGEADPLPADPGAAEVRGNAVCGDLGGHDHDAGARIHRAPGRDDPQLRVGSGEWAVGSPLPTPHCPLPTQRIPTSPFTLSI